MWKNFSTMIMVLGLVLIVGVETCAEVGDNLCLNAQIIDSSGSVEAEDELVKFLVDDDISTKWCSGGRQPEEPHLIDEGVENWVVFDFGEQKFFNRYQIFHASLCERDYGNTKYDTRSWIVEVSDDLENWTEISRVSDNTLNCNDISFDLTYARYLRLLISEPEQSESSVTRIAEFKVIESDGYGNTGSESVVDVVAEIEARKAEEDLAARKSLIIPAVIYWSCCLVFGLIVVLSVRFIKQYKKN